MNELLGASHQGSGDFVILIDSRGGSVDAGAQMINAVARIKGKSRAICVVVGDAMSMAFNFLTACDIRLAVKDTRLLAHHFAAGDLTGAPRLTSRLFRALADDLDKTEEPYSVANSKAMHVSREQYEMIADDEFMFGPDALVDMGYLNGIADVQQ